MMDQLHEKQSSLIAYLRGLGKTAIAFSGGVDSTFLLKTAYDALGDDVLAIIGKTVSVPNREYLEAVSFCRSLGVQHTVIGIDQMSIEGFADNPPERCYLCKKALFAAFLKEAASRGFSFVAEGSNMDDLGDYRPGLKALSELGIRSPLREADLTKVDVRALSRELDLPTWNKPSFACLATRIPCGEEITEEKLHMVEEAEECLFDLGFTQVRVRHHGEIARIEVVKEEMTKLLEPDVAMIVTGRLREIGFRYITVDLDGYRTGSTNPKDTIEEENKRE